MTLSVCLVRIVNGARRELSPHFVRRDALGRLTTFRNHCLYLRKLRTTQHKSKVPAGTFFFFVSDDRRRKPQLLHKYIASWSLLELQCRLFAKHLTFFIAPFRDIPSKVHTANRYLCLSRLSLACNRSSVLSKDLELFLHIDFSRSLAKFDQSQMDILYIKRFSASLTFRLIPTCSDEVGLAAGVGASPSEPCEECLKHDPKRWLVKPRRF